MSLPLLLPPLGSSTLLKPPWPPQVHRSLPSAKLTLNRQYGYIVGSDGVQPDSPVYQLDQIYYTEGAYGEIGNPYWRVGTDLRGISSIQDCTAQFAGIFFDSNTAPPGTCDGSFSESHLFNLRERMNTDSKSLNSLQPWWPILWQARMPLQIRLSIEQRALGRVHGIGNC